MALSAQDSRVRLLLLAPLLLSALAGFRLLEPNTALIDDNGLNVLIATVVVLLLPGLVLNDFFRTKSATLFDALAHGVAASLVITVGAAFFTIAFQGTLTHWCLAVVAWNIAGCLVLMLKIPRESGPLVTVMRARGRYSEPLDWCLVLLVSILSFGLYRAGNDVSWVGWETGTEAVYARLILEASALNFEKVSLRPEVALHNLFFAWSFILAGISKLANVDPLVVTLRSRFMLAALGFPAFFLFVMHFLRSVHAARQTTWILLILITSGFLWLEPSPLVRAGLGDRPIFAFLGSIHHADVALDIVLPLLCAYLFNFFYRGRTTTLIALCTLMAATFFIHAREWFQVMWYAVIAFPVCLLLPNYTVDRKDIVIRFAVLGTALLAVAGATYIATQIFGNSDTHAGEFATKSRLLRELFSVSLALSAESLLNFRMHYYGGPSPTPPNVYSWLLLTAIALPLLVLYGSSAELRATAFLVLLWWCTVCYALSQHLLLVLSYSEILTAKVRLIYLFSYAVLGAALARTIAFIQLKLNSQRVPKRPGRFAVAGTMFGVGIVIALLWQMESPEFTVLRIVGGFLLAFAVVLLGYYATNWRSPVCARDLHIKPSPRTGTVVVCTSLFVIPSIPLSDKHFAYDLLTTSRSPDSVVGESSPLGLSPGLLQFTRKNVPTRARIAVDPLGTHVLGLVAPVQVVPIPRGQILADYPEIKARRNDLHPLFNSRFATGRANIESIKRYLIARDIDFILGTEEFADPVEQLTKTIPSMFETVYVDRERLEVMVRVLRFSTVSGEYER